MSISSVAPGPLRILAGLLLTVPALVSYHPLAKADEPGVLGEQLTPQLGHPVDPIRGSIVSPDGSGLPGGHGSVAEGALIYRSRCSACHGLDGRQKDNALAGGIGSLATPEPLKTVGSYWPYATTLFDYIARAMPYDSPRSLSANETYALTAYLLWLNDIVDEEASLDATRLREIKMPNRTGFVELWPRR